jgi:hypothetical protein
MLVDDMSDEEWSFTPFFEGRKEEKGGYISSYFL